MDQILWRQIWILGAKGTSGLKEGDCIVRGPRAGIIWMCRRNVLGTNSDLLPIMCVASFLFSQKKMKQSKGDFETFCRKIGWTTTDGDVERKKRWFGASEFIYDVKKAPEGHLPLTSALRGTSLITKLLEHPLWENEDWKNEP